MRDPNRKKHCGHIRWVVAVLAAVMLAAMLAGCSTSRSGGEGGGSAQVPPTAPQTAIGTEQTTQETDGSEAENADYEVTDAEEDQGYRSYANQMLAVLEEFFPEDYSEDLQIELVKVELAKENLSRDTLPAELLKPGMEGFWTDALKAFENYRCIRSMAGILQDNPGMQEAMEALRSDMDTLYVGAVDEILTALTEADEFGIQFRQTAEFNMAAECFPFEEWIDTITLLENVRSKEIFAAIPTGSEKLDQSIAELKDGLAACEAEVCESLKKRNEIPDLHQKIAALSEQAAEIRNSALEIEIALNSREDTRRDFQLGEIGTMRESLSEFRKEVQEADDQLIFKSLFGFIALGVAILAVILSVIALIFAVKKHGQKVQETGVSPEVLDRVENLRQRQQIDHDAQKNLQQKVDELGEQCAALRKQISEFHTRETYEPKNPLEQVPATTPVVPVELPQCYLKLEYQLIDPESSFLKQKADGIYPYYTGGRVGLADSELGKTNQMVGWQGCGLLYLFNVQINGKEYTSESLAVHKGFYKCTEVLRRAEVASAGSTGTYKRIHKGCIRMEKQE